MALLYTQVRQLKAKLNAKHVRSRNSNGNELHYVEGWHVISEANRIFGFDAWDRQTLTTDCVWSGSSGDGFAAAYTARVRIRVRAGDLAIIRDGSGSGEGRAPTRGQAHDLALKAAETDATKRALATFGNATNDDFAPALGISISTFHLWKREHDEFAEATETPPDRCNATVERSLLRCALGYDYETQKVIDTREGPFVRTVARHYPPSVEALEFLLPVRLPHLYGAKPEMDTFVRFLQSLAEDAPPSQPVFNEETLEDGSYRVARVMSRLWASDAEIAAALGISLESFKVLRNQDPELTDALKSGKEATSRALEWALAQRASGYDFSEEDVFCSREGDISKVRVRRRLPPDSTALDLWLRAHPDSPEPAAAS